MLIIAKLVYKSQLTTIYVYFKYTKTSKRLNSIFYFEETFILFFFGKQLILLYSIMVHFSRVSKSFFPCIYIQSNTKHRKKKSTIKFRLYFIYIYIKEYTELPLYTLQPPVPAAPWNGERQTVKDSAICIQRDPFRRDVEIEGSEDCLYLNVYAPQVLLYKFSFFFSVKKLFATSFNNIILF